MSIAELLAPYEVSEDDFVVELAGALAGTPQTSTSTLTGDQESVLAEHGGIIAAGGEREPASTARAGLRALSANLAEQARTSIPVTQAAERLGVDASRVRHRVRDHALYGFKIGSSLRLPLWQFTSDGTPLPGLRAVLAALPADLHPLEVAGFMTTADPDLTVADEALSPRQWLTAGGDVRVVCAIAADLDTW